jgi:CheY-like chemotaxis protein
VLDLSEVVGDVRPMLERLIGEDIQMELVATKNPALVMADRGQIEQVLVNLVVNARAAMPNGGRIVLRIANIELKDEARSRARGGAPGSYVLFSISDTGVGIAPEAIGRVFEPFFTTKEAGKGTGLGLATVYGIVRQSGGFIEVASDARPGGGTTFEIFIPAVVTGGGVPHIAETILPLPTPSRGTETVLVVEDEAALRKLLRRTLEKQRYTVMVAQSGRDALAQILDHKGVVDLVVTDVVMPQMGGPEFVQHLRISHPDVPVLYLSGYTDDEIVRRGVVQSETKLLGKPFTTEQLLTAVRELLDAASPVGGGGR